MKLDIKQVDAKLDEMLCNFEKLAKEISEERDKETQENFFRLIVHLENYKLILKNKLNGSQGDDEECKKHLETFQDNCSKMIDTAEFPVEVKTYASGYLIRFKAWLAEQFPSIFEPPADINVQANEKMKAYKQSFQERIGQIQKTEQKDDVGELDNGNNLKFNH